jgi:hypothetical protein
MPGAAYEYVFERRLAHRYCLNFSGKCLDYIGDETVSAVAFNAHLISQYCCLY